MPTLTPRYVLQVWGTEVARRGFHDDIWIASLENKLRKTQDDVVISDCRFPNEIAAIRRAGGIVVGVHRGPNPTWYGIALAANQHEQPNADSKILTELGIHASETAWIGTQFDAVIDNNADGMDHLYSQLNGLVLNLQVSRVDLI
jgi:hypothetical protein